MFGKITFAAILWLLVTLGCATTPYRYGRFHAPTPPGSKPEAVVVEFGTPRKTLDHIAKVVGWSARVLPMNSKINSHELSPETIDKLVGYLARNDLADVYVAVNQYNPKDQWRRLRENKAVAPGWRYSLGTLNMIAYTLFPGRIFGGDKYNPYTNSLYLNSDVPAVVIREAAYAKAVHSRRLPGTYAAISNLPGFSMRRQTRCVGDVIGYARAQHDWPVEKQAFRVLYPQLGAQATSIGGPLTGVWWGGPTLGLGGAAMGHVVGRRVAARRSREMGEPDRRQTSAADADVNEAANVSQEAQR